MASQYIKEKQKLVGIRYMLFVIAGVNAVISIILSITSSFLESAVPTYLQALVSGLLAYMIPIVIYAKTNKITSQTAAERFYMKECKVTLLGLVAVMGVAFQFVMVIVNLPVNMLVGNTESYMPKSPLELFAAMIIIAVLPAIFEEFLFRGIVVGSMVEFNTTAAAIFSSVMFAILHADICGFAGYVLMGLVLTSIVRRSGSLYPAMVFHFVNNATALLLGYFNEELVYAPFLTIVLFVIGTTVFIGLYAAFRFLYKKPEKVASMKTGQLLGQSFVSMPIILSVGLVVLTVILMRNM